MDEKSNANATNLTHPNPARRVVGLDCHPDSFTAALLTGQTPAQAVVQKIFNRVPIGQLGSWAKKHTSEQDELVLEASGNSFEVVRTLEAVDREAKVLESSHLGKLKEAHANNDKISAVRIGKAYLAGTCKEVWVPDLKTQERRDWMHGYRKAIKRTTQLSNRIQSYLSDNGVRLSLEPEASEAFLQQLLQTKSWSASQQQLLELYLSDLRHAQQQRQRWLSLMAQEVLNDPLMLSLVRLCGIRDIVAFAVVAVVGTIDRFAKPKQLVKYIGLNPAFDDSGEDQWSGGIGGQGRKDLRSLLMESAQSILRTNHPLGKWGRRLLARKGSSNLAVAAVARKITVAIWYLLKGQWSTLEDITAQLEIKIGKIISHVGVPAMKKLGQTRAQLRQAAYENLKKGRIYQLDPERTCLSTASPAQAVCPRCGAQKKHPKTTAKPTAIANPKVKRREPRASRSRSSPAPRLTRVQNPPP